MALGSIAVAEFYVNPVSVTILSITVLGLDAYLVSKYGSHFVFSTLGLAAAVTSLLSFVLLKHLAKGFTVVVDFTIVSVLWVLWLASFSAYFASTCNTKTLKFQFYARDIPHDVPNTPKISHVPRSHLDINVIDCSLPTVAARLTFVPFLILIVYWIILLIELISELEDGRFGHVQSNEEVPFETPIQCYNPPAGYHPPLPTHHTQSSPA